MRQRVEAGRAGNRRHQIAEVAARARDHDQSAIGRRGALAVQPAPFALDLGARDQVVVHVQQLSAFRAEPVQHAASDQLPVGLGVAQGGVVPGQVGLAISAVFGKAVVAVPLDMLFQDGAAQATRPAVDQQDESVQIQPQRVDRLRVADGVDALQFGEVVAAAYGAQRLPMADIGGRQLVHERLPAVIQRSVDIAEPLFPAWPSRPCGRRCRCSIATCRSRYRRRSGQVQASGGEEGGAHRIAATRMQVGHAGDAAHAGEPGGRSCWIALPSIQVSSEAISVTRSDSA